MTAFLLLVLGFVLAYLLQLHVLPVLGWVLTTPELLFAVCAAGSMTQGSNRTLPLALLFGAAADLTLGLGYGLFLLPMTAAAFFFEPMGQTAFERPYRTALIAGAASVLARLFRICIIVFLRHGFFPAGREWFALVGCGVFSAAAVLLMLFIADRRRRRQREGRYQL